MRTYKPATTYWVATVSATAVAVTVLSVALRDQGGTTATTPWLPLLAVLLLASCAAIAHVFPIRSAGDNAFYSLTNVFVVAGAVVLPAHLITLLVVAALSPETWLRRHRKGALMRWMFNVGQASLAAHLAGAWVRWSSGGDLSLDQPAHFLALAGAALLFTLAQAILVGVAIALQSGIPLRRADTLTPTALQSDSLVALQGLIVAGMWLAAPVLLGFLPPLLLIAHRLTRSAHLAQVAQVDVKTGLYNSRHFEQVLRDELDHSLRLSRPLSLIFVDLDHFKRVNDQHGHAAGDLVLREVASILQQHVRKDDTLARFGGEEFVVVLPGTDIKEAAYLGERLRSAVEEHPYLLDSGATLRCTASVGVATCPQHGTDVSRLLEEADAAMYQAKKTRNAVVCAQGLSAVPRLAGDAARASGADGPAGPGGGANGQSPAGRRKVDQAGEANSRPAATPLAGRVLLWSTVAAGAAAGALSLALTVRDGAWLLLVPFVAMAIFAEILKVQVYEASQERVSLSFTIAVTMAALTVHPEMAPLISLAAAGVHSLLAGKRQPPSKLLFNLANPTLAAAAASGVYLALAPLTAEVSIWFMGAALAGVTAFYVTNVGIISTMIGVHTGQPFAEVIRKSAWFGPTNILIGLTGAFLGGAYPQLGPVGIVMFAVPVLVLRFTLTFYARQAQRTIQTLELAKAQVEEAHEEKEEMLRKLIETVAQIIDARDNSVSGHSRRVAKYAVAIGRELGMGTADLATLHTAGLFHDLGKVGIPELLLHKPARLTDDEFSVVKQHAEIGERILSEVPQLADIARMVGEHHERWDGTGYPKSLKSDEISLGGRILMVADALETMLADRPYSKGRDLSAALEELNHCAGTHFAPEVVEAVHRSMARFGPAFFTDPIDDMAGEPELMAPINSAQKQLSAAERLLHQVFVAPDGTAA